MVNPIPKTHWKIAHFDDFKSYRSYPSMCVEDIYQDRTGKLWLKSCGSAIQLSAHLFSFDGYNFDIVQGELSKIGNQVNIAGVIQDTLYGYDLDDGVYRYFKMNLINQQFQYYDSLPYYKSMNMVVDNDKIYQYYTQQNTINIKNLGRKIRFSTNEIKLGSNLGLDSLKREYVNIRKRPDMGFGILHHLSFIIVNLINNNKSKIDVSKYFHQHKFTPRELKLMELKFSDELLHLVFTKSNYWYQKTFQLYPNHQIFD